MNLKWFRDRMILVRDTDKTETLAQFTYENLTVEDGLAKGFFELAGEVPVSVVWKAGRNPAKTGKAVTRRYTGFFSDRIEL